MSKRLYRRLLRQARRLAKQQQAALLALEVEGVVAVTLHSATRTLTIATERDVGAQLIGELTEFLHHRRQTLQTELRQLPARPSTTRPPATPAGAPPAPSAAAGS